MVNIFYYLSGLVYTEELYLGNFWGKDIRLI
jgi:hypothetical protein